MAKLEFQIEDIMAYYANNPDKLSEYLRSVNVQEEESDTSMLISNIEKLTKRQEQFNKERERIARLYRKRLINDNDAEKQLEEIVKEEEELNQQINKINSRLNNKIKQSGEIDDFVNRFIEIMGSFGSVPYYSKKKLLEDFIGRIYVRRTDKANQTAYCKLDTSVEFKV